MARILLIILLYGVGRIPSSAQEADAFSGDARLLKRHTVKAAGIPLKDLLEDLSKQTGIQLTAGPRVAEDKVVLYAHDRPLADSLRVIARFFNFYWGRTGEPGAYMYTLSQSLKQQSAESAEIEADYSRAADLILRELRITLELSQRNSEELKSLAEDVTAQSEREDDPAKKQEGRLKAYTAKSLANEPYRADLARQLTSFGKDGILRILNGERADYVYPPVEGRNSLSQGTAESILASSRARRATNREFTLASVEFRGSGSTHPSIQVMVRAGHRSPSGGTSMSGSSFPIPIFGATPPPSAPAWEKDPRFARKISLSVPFREVRTEADGRRLPVPFLARVILRLEEAVPLDIIGDAFFSVLGTPITVKDQPLGTALTQICQNTNHVWTLAGGFVQVKDQKYAAARAREPSVFRLRSWAALPDDELLSLDRMAEIASQGLPRFGTSIAVLSEACGFETRGELYGAHSHLLFWSALTPAQRSAALSESGLPFRRLTTRQRQMFEQVSSDLSGREDDPFAPKIPTWTPEKLINSTFTVTRQDQEMIGVRTATGSSAFGISASREMALENARRSNPGIAAGDIWEVRGKMYRFQYSQDEPARTAHIHLPRAWIKPKAPAHTLRPSKDQ